MRSLLFVQIVYSQVVRRGFNLPDLHFGCKVTTICGNMQYLFGSINPYEESETMEILKNR